MSSAVNSRWQLITADENENQPRGLKFSTSINLSVYIKIPVNFFSYQLSSTGISCQRLSAGWKQLITVDENENQPRELKFGKSINLSVYIKILVIFFSYLPSSAFSRPAGVAMLGPQASSSPTRRKNLVLAVAQVSGNCNMASPAGTLHYYKYLGCLLSGSQINWPYSMQPNNSEKAAGKAMITGDNKRKSKMNESYAIYI